jgi:predicted ATP-grasp superfamily ATP-dependent carboligase
MIPVVVVNSSLNSLGVVRSLAAGGMPIYLVATTRRAAAAWSRYCRVELFPNLHGRDLIDGLVQLSRRIGPRPVLILTSDVEVATISMHREELAPFFRISLPSKEIVQALADKTLFQKFAEREGFPMPRAVVVHGAAELPLLNALSLPVVIKPGDKTLVLDGRVERAVRSDTRESAQAVASQMLKCAGRLVVQEWIEGADTDIYFTLFACDGDGRAMAMFVGRKLVCDPPAVGNTAVCVEAPEVAAELESITRQFIARTDYRGIGSLEFKRNKKDGRFLIIEPTVGRTDWQEEIATLCGVNIPLVTYWTEIGQAISTGSRKSAQVVWRASVGHRLPRATLALRTQTFDGYFRFGDPLPGIYHYVIEKLIERAYGVVRRNLTRNRIGGKVVRTKVK